MNQTRQLAAILFTDIAGYTSIMHSDESLAVKMLKHHRSVLERTVADYEGKVIEYVGDGSLCIFSSITEAMNCALSIQIQLQSDPAVPLRIGVHIGEVLYEDGKVMGDGVNLASRIQTLGRSGSILFSREVFDKIRNHHEFKTVFLGRFQLRNVTEPMDVFALSNDGLTVPGKDEIEGRIKEVVPEGKFRSRLKWVIISTAAIALMLFALFRWGLPNRKNRFTGHDKSIAVLPFENISNDTMQQYFSDGMTEDIITQLSKIADLKVISRTSVMQYKDRNKSIKEIAEELGVAAILEGSVRKEGEKVRITAQLIDASTDKHIWAETYDRNASEVFAIQSEVAQRIANQLNVKLTADEGKRIGERATSNVRAYEEYLRAKQLPWPQRLEAMEKVIQMDSTFALAWAELASAYSKMPMRNMSDKPHYVRRSLDAALMAVSYGPRLSETHMILGDVLKVITLNPGISIRELNKSVKLNPNNAEAYIYLAFAQMELGDFTEAEKNLQKAKLLDPHSDMKFDALATLYRYSRNPDKLMSLQNQLRALNRPGTEARARLWYHFLKDEYDSILSIRRPYTSPALIGIALIRTGQVKKARDLADSLLSASVYDHAFSIGIIYAWMGEKKKAIEYLNIAYRMYDYGLISIKVDKLFDPLREEEGFKELLRKMGMG